MPALAMSAEAGDEGVMKRRPRPRSQPIVFGRMWVQIFAHSLVSAAAALTSVILGLYLNFGAVLQDDILPAGADPANLTCRRYEGGSWTTVEAGSCVKEGLQRARTMAFITISLAELLRAFSVRQSAPCWHKPLVNTSLNKLWSVALALVLVVALVPGACSRLAPHGTLGDHCSTTWPPQV